MLPEQSLAKPACWLRFFPRWSLLVGLATAALVVVFYFGVGTQAADNTLGVEYVDLLQAMRNPAMFRVGWTLDALIWLMLGGSLLSLAGILHHHAPRRANFIAFCGLAQLSGALGSFIRLNSISDIAARYVTADPEQQAVLLESYLNLWRVINAHNHMGVLLQGVGYLLVVWGVFTLRGFPRWLAVWLALPGLLALTQFIFVAVGAPFLHVLNIFGVLVGNIALNLATAVSLWHPSPTLASAVIATPSTFTSHRS